MKRPPLTLIGMLIGFLVFIGFELVGAFNGTPGDTFSEFYVSLPQWVMLFSAFCFGGVCAHLWRWMIGKPTVWLVERNISGTVEYLSIRDGAFWWTAYPSTALHFMDEQSGKSMIQMFADKNSLTITAQNWPIQ